METFQVVDCHAGPAERSSRAPPIRTVLQADRQVALFPICVYSQPFLLSDVKGSCHVDEGRKAVKVVTVGMRENGVCLEMRKKNHLTSRNTQRGKDTRFSQS